MKPTKIRIGSGFDVHQLKEGESLILGGVNIPFNKGTVAHSDGDVVIHAICDALLGAVSLRDIGFHFPDNSSEFKNIDSRILLQKSFKLIKDKGYTLGNLDVTICMEKPKLMGYIPEMQKIIAEVLDTDVENISIKATTTERLGFVGEEKGVAVFATCLLFPE
ncbi:MAG: 2-C-methyl-D-erythritol 2,4-cyclodiphosphate synthase [Bacteroidetes bacterium GWF2_38_335]|nr:MAG: 2-C-methyl-D-erythritol 2,4-cyclodiphosphate synthase [Bacteroidetes bacterium GWF2_38_335]OFY81495.1 MAG: 2-C-methyl-D-erythritol 2,4-cyclodiphosphate synthase [Bacteroidetes bacterium RIFOXYA12_FULL_38_20]HBS87662.1 2-C-methyl-D-erythritol 2,4-cyclodiphosphate synthase [Bacteroidales bacterium]